MDMKYNIHATDARGRNAVFYAALYDQFDMVTFLLEQGVDPKFLAQINGLLRGYGSPSSNAQLTHGIQGFTQVNHGQGVLFQDRRHKDRLQTGPGVKILTEILEG